MRNKMGEHFAYRDLFSGPRKSPTVGVSLDNKCLHHLMRQNQPYRRCHRQPAYLSISKPAITKRRRKLLAHGVRSPGRLVRPWDAGNATRGGGVKCPKPLFSPNNVGGVTRAGSSQISVSVLKSNGNGAHAFVKDGLRGHESGVRRCLGEGGGSERDPDLQEGVEEGASPEGPERRRGVGGSQRLLGGVRATGSPLACVHFNVGVLRARAFKNRAALLKT